MGDWKLLAKGRNGAWELYNVVADRSELHDLAAARPERVKAMAALWDAWAKRANALPWPGRGRKAKPKPNQPKA